MTPEVLGMLVLATLVTIWLIMWQRRGGQLERLKREHKEFEGEEYAHIWYEEREAMLNVHRRIRP